MNQPTTPPAEICDTDPASISADHAQQLIFDAITPVTQIETIALNSALGRVAAADIKSRAPVPNHTNSAMDGYALAGADLPTAAGAKTFAVIGTALAGLPFAGQVGAGHCVRITTGAVMPPGTDSVVVQERVQRDGDTIIIPPGEPTAANVRHAGEDLAAGDTAIPAGTRLTPPHLGLAASLGLAELPVWRRPRVAFFSNGDELRPLGTPLAIGELHDSNRHTLRAMLAELGADMVDLGLVADDPAALAAALSAAAACADVVITTAGASVGDADHIRDTFTRLGEILFFKVAIKPGRPLAFGRIGGGGGGNGGSDDGSDGGIGGSGVGDNSGTPNTPTLLFALPGNPVSVIVTFDLFVAPALNRLSGATPTPPLRIMAQTQTPLKKRPGRTEYQRGILTTPPTGAPQVSTTGQQGSGILRTMAAANCYIILPTESTGAAPGDMVEVRPFPRP